MADFTSGFWHYFIIAGAVGGIIGVTWLVWANATDTRKGGKAEGMGHVWDEDLEELNNPLPRWWLMLFYITLVFAVIYFVLYPALGTYAGVLGWTSTQQYEDEVMAAEANYAPLYESYLKKDLKPLATDEDAMRTGERLYVNYCAVCHGSDARGARGFPNLRDADWLYGGQPEQIKTSILQGRKGAMPGWESALGGDQGVTEVTHYVMSLSDREDVDPAKVKAGEQKYKQFCVACHGIDGKGNQAMGAPNLTDNTWLYGGSERAIYKSIAQGRNGVMPSHKDFLGEAKSHVLAAYVYSLSQDQQ
jgi:cytochrome c oxidase cbb3-type subunit 3